MIRRTSSLLDTSTAPAATTAGRCDSGHVVVVALEAAFGDAGRAGEGVQLLEGLVADEVAPEPATAGPGRLVHENGHDQRA